VTGGRLEDEKWATQSEQKAKLSKQSQFEWLTPRCAPLASVQRLPACWLLISDYFSRGKADFIENARFGGCKQLIGRELNEGENT
jgi:hypothetical protein